MTIETGNGTALFEKDGYGIEIDYSDAGVAGAEEQITQLAISAYSYTDGPEDDDYDTTPIFSIVLSATAVLSALEAVVADLRVYTQAADD